MKIKDLFYCFIGVSFFLSACSENRTPVINENGEYKVFNNNIVDSIEFSSPYSCNIFTSVYKKEISDENFQFFMTQNLDSIIFFDKNNEFKGFDIPFNSSVSINKFYVHNFDTIVIYIDRVEMSMNNIENDSSFSDIYLIDSNGRILNEYNLDNINLYFDGERRNFVRTKSSVFDSKNYILNNKLLLDLEYICYDTIAAKDNPYLLYQLDLSSGKVKPLEVKMENHKYYKHPRFTSAFLEASYINDNEIVFQFAQSPEVQKYNIETKEIEIIYSGDMEFFPIQYDSIKDYRINWNGIVKHSDSDFSYRRVQMMNNKRFEYFSIIQVFNNDFELIGYSFGTSINKTGVEDLCLYKNNNFNKFYVLNLAEEFTYMSKQDIINKYYPEKIKDDRLDMIFTNTVPLSYRSNDYLNKLKKDGFIDPQTTTAIMLCSDITCTSCVEYICEAVATTIAKKLNESFKIIVFGKKDLNLDQFTNGKSIIDNSMIVYIDNLDYQKYLTKDEDHLYYYINLEEEYNDIIIVPMDSLHSSMINFMEKNDIDYVLKTE